MATLTGPLNKSANTSGTTLVAKATTDTTYGCSIGDMLVLAFVCNSSTATLSVADSAGNTWVQVDSASGGANNLTGVWVCRVTVALPTNGTVTVTCSSVSRRASQLYKISGAGGFLTRNRLIHAVGATTALSLNSFGSIGDADEYAFKFDGMTPAGVASGRADATAGWTDKGTIDSGGATVSVSLGSSFRAATTRGWSQFANTATQSTAAARSSIGLSIRGISAPADTMVQTFSPNTVIATTVTATPLFAPVTGNTLIAVVSTNENAGADDINTPSFWTLIATQRNAAGTHVRMKIFGITVADWIANGSPALTFTSTAAQRMQLTMGEFSGEYNLTAEVTGTDEGTTGTSGTTGSVTPLGTGRLVIMAFAEKNAQPASDAAGTPTWQALTTWNEDPSVLSTQKLSQWVGYVDNRGASATSTNITWSTTSTAWSGLTVSLALAAGAAGDYGQATESAPYVARYVAPLSRVFGLFSPNPAAPDPYTALVLERSTPFYRGSYSAVSNAADEFIPLWGTPAYLSRQEPAYTPPRSLVGNVYDNTVAPTPDTYAAVTLNRPTPFYGGERPLVIAAFDNPTVPIAQVWASMIQSRQEPYYGVMRPVAIQVFDQPAAPAAPVWVPQPVTSTRRSRVEAARSWTQVVAFLAAYAPTTASARAEQAKRARSLVVNGYLTPVVIGGSQYTVVVRGRSVAFYRGSYSSIMPAADEEIIPYVPPEPPIPPVLPAPNTGGGGEWVIWLAPDFRANRRDAFKRFEVPGFRKPSRREKRGY